MIRCFNCQKYGHFDRNCTAEHPFCERCAGIHSTETCLCELNIHSQQQPLFTKIVEFTLNVPLNSGAALRHGFIFRGIMSPFNVEALEQWFSAVMW